MAADTRASRNRATAEVVFPVVRRRRTIRPPSNPPPNTRKAIPCQDYIVAGLSVSLLLALAFVQLMPNPGAESEDSTDQPAKTPVVKAADAWPDTPEADAIISALQIFPPDNPWNTDISGWPVATNSDKIISSIGNEKPLRYNADMAFVIVGPDQKKIDVKLGEGQAESDPGPYPVPDNMPIEGWPAMFKRDPAYRQRHAQRRRAASRQAQPATTTAMRSRRRSGQSTCCMNSTRPRRSARVGRPIKASKFDVSSN